MRNVVRKGERLFVLAHLIVIYRYYARIIAASVASRRVAELSNPDRTALGRLILKGAA
jgi:hypothetical protein